MLSYFISKGIKTASEFFRSISTIWVTSSTCRRPTVSFSFTKNAVFWGFPELCIIIDANIAHQFKTPAHKDVEPVVQWLTSPKQKGHAVVGGELRRELDKVDTIRRFFRVLKEAGRLIYKDDAEVDAETITVQVDLETLGFKKADDPHIIALARISGSRLLASH